MPGPSPTYVVNVQPDPHADMRLRIEEMNKWSRLQREQKRQSRSDRRAAITFGIGFLLGALPLLLERFNATAGIVVLCYLMVVLIVVSLWPSIR